MSSRDRETANSRLTKTNGAELWDSGEKPEDTLFPSLSLSDTDRKTDNGLSVVFLRHHLQSEKHWYSTNYRILTCNGLTLTVPHPTPGPAQSCFCQETLI